MAERKLNIFTLLSRIDQKDRQYIDTLEDQELKEYQPFVVMRWLTGTRDARQVYFTNELVNKYAFDLNQHKKLLYYLQCIAASGQSKRYQWLKPGSKKGDGTLTTSVVKQYFGYSSREAKHFIPLLSNDQILEYAEQLGWQKEEIAKLKKELKGRYGKV